MDGQTSRPPGLQGTYEGSCVVCLQGTDTGLALRGAAEWIVAGLMKLGIHAQEEAVAIVGRATGRDPGMLFNGTVTVLIRVCESCVRKSGTRMQVGLLASEVVPVYQQS